VWLVPGGTALSSWVCVLFHVEPRLSQASTTNGLLAAFLFTLASLAAGKVLDSLGSWWEAGVNDRFLKEKYFPSLEEDWNAYLRMAFSQEPVGIRYIRDTVLSLKFELNQGLAFVAFWLGLCPLIFLQSRLTLIHVLVLTPIVFGMAAVLLYDSYNSSKVLAKTRRELRKGVIRIEAQTP
jgi:hypothetical protein